MCATGKSIRSFRSRGPRYIRMSSTDKVFSDINKAIDNIKDGSSMCVNVVHFHCSVPVHVFMLLLRVVLIVVVRVDSVWQVSQRI